MIDDKDREILRILQDNARITNVKIARQVNLAPSAVLKRIRTMEEEGIIEGYEAKVNNLAVGLGMTSFVIVHSDEKPGTLEIGKRIAEFPDVQEVHFTAGDFYYLLKVRLKDPETHADFVRRLGDVGVRDNHTILVLKTIKETHKLEI